MTPNELPARQHRHREERFVAILRQLVERLESWIVERVTANGYRGAVRSHPSSDALSHAQLETIDDIRVRRLRRTQHQVVVLEHVDEARVTLDDGGNEVDHAGQHRVQGIGGSDAAADFVKQIDIGPSAHVGLALG